MVTVKCCGVLVKCVLQLRTGVADDNNRNFEYGKISWCSIEKMTPV